MVRALDLSYTIGLVKRGGSYAASNERSEEKLASLHYQAKMPCPRVWNEAELRELRGLAKEFGYRVVTHFAGFNRK